MTEVKYLAGLSICTGTVREMVVGMHIDVIMTSTCGAKAGASFTCLYQDCQCITVVCCLPGLLKPTC
jgi:hypothetical protein